MYCPKNIDITAYEGYLKSCIASERERYAIAIARTEAHKAGYEEGISVALELSLIHISAEAHNGSTLGKLDELGWRSICKPRQG